MQKEIIKSTEVNSKSNVDLCFKPKETEVNIKQDKVIFELKKVVEKDDIINSTKKKCMEFKAKWIEKSTEYETLAKVAGQMFNDIKEFDMKESEYIDKNKTGSKAKESNSTSSSENS